MTVRAGASLVGVDFVGVDASRAVVFDALVAIVETAEEDIFNGRAERSSPSPAT